MSFKNIPILWKIILTLGLLGIVSIGATIFATQQMRTIDTSYNALLDGSSTRRVSIHP